MKVKILTNQEAREKKDEILGLERYINNIGGPDWTEENLFKELPDKWNLSFYITNEQDKIIAYLISSNRDGYYHMHRTFIIPELRKKLTFVLVRHAVRIAKENGFNELSWKVGEGIESYEGSFRIADRVEFLGKIEGHEFYMFYTTIKDRTI